MTAFRGDSLVRMIVRSSRQYDRDSFTETNAGFRYDMHFQESHLGPDTALLADDYVVAGPFVNVRPLAPS